MEKKRLVACLILAVVCVALTSCIAVVGGGNAEAKHNHRDIALENGWCETCKIGYVGEKYYVKKCCYQAAKEGKQCGCVKSEEKKDDKPK